MNKLYPFATLLSAILLTHGAMAQNTYTAVRSGNWHVPSGTNVWDPNGEPPTACNNCSITISSGVTVTLNAHIVLSGGSTVTVGTDGSSSAVLLIPATANNSTWETSDNIILADGVPMNSVKLKDGTGIISASSAGRHDGILIQHNTSYYKQVGNSPNNFDDTTAITYGPATYGTSQVGPKTLSSNGILPLDLTAFDAVVDNGEVSLSWTTLSESNTDHFDIQRSSNGGAKWDVIGKVPAHGYSSMPLNYSFTDANPGSGTIQYRVNGYDRDGKPTYTPVKVIRTTPLANISIFPNPAKDYINVSLPVGDATIGLVSIRLFGNSGQLLAERNVTGGGGTIQTFPVSNFPPGNYLVHITAADGSKQVSKVLISRQ